LPASAQVLVALGLLAILPAPASASGIVNFRLSDTDTTGAPPVSSVLMSIVPADSVAPTDPSVSPLTILSGSSGFDPSKLQVFLGDGTTPTGDPFQALKLDFGTSGFQPGGNLYFSLNLSPTYSGLVNLVLPSSVNNLTITSLPANFGSGGGQTNTPEPLSIVLWSSIAALGLVRARAYRRAHPAA
jgi:hypothetical protein